MNKILVIGSINADFVTMSSRLPRVGETIIGSDFKVYAGGKGANQAVAAARFGASVDFMGCVGLDENGKSMLSNLVDNGVDVSNCLVVDDMVTGMANITVVDGDNSIIVVPGANSYVHDKFIKARSLVIKSYKYVLVQNEVSSLALEELVNHLSLDAVLIYNPAPYVSMSQGFFDRVNFCIPNEGEYEQILANNNLVDSSKVILTLGENGVRYLGNNCKYPAMSVNVVDTTGAGDTFCGCFSALLANGYELDLAIKLATKSATLSVTKFGAQEGMMSFSEVCDEKDWNIK